MGRVRGSRLIDVHSTDTRADRTANVALDVYRLVSIDSTSAPAPAVGDDWLVYRIALGGSVVTGYRRGTRASVTSDVERIVQAFNERRIVRPRRVHIRLGKAGLPQPSAQVRDKDPV